MTDTQMCEFPGCTEDSEVPAVLKDGDVIVGATSYCGTHAKERGLSDDSAASEVNPDQ